MNQERFRPQPTTHELTDLFTNLIDIKTDLFAKKFSTVIAVGLDICQVSLVEDMLSQEMEPFPNVLTGEEIAYCQQYGRKQAQHIAGFFAAKEAVYKTLGKTPGGSWHEIHIDHDEDGAPVVRLEGKVKERADELKIADMKLSITQDSFVGAALCVAIGKTHRKDADTS